MARLIATISDAMAVERDQTFAGQVTHRLPDRGGAHIELIGDLGLHQTRSPRQITTKDGRTQGVTDQVDSGDAARARYVEAEPVLHVVYYTEYRTCDPVDHTLLS
jgi:hypothetical protein